MVSIRDDGGMDLAVDHIGASTGVGMYHRIFIGFPWDTRNHYEIPVIPEMIAGSDGQNITTHNIVSIGEVALLGGPKIRKLAWESHFPKEYDRSIEHMTSDAHVHPEQWKEWFRRVQREHTWMRVSILRAAIDKRFAIASFDWSYVPGPEGDLWYQIQLVEYRETRIREFDGSKFPDVDVRPPPYGALPSTYTTKPGQSLQDVSLILFGTTTQWVELYKANSHILLGPLVKAGEFEDWEVEPGTGNVSQGPRHNTLSWEEFMNLWEASQPVPSGTVLVVPAGLSAEPVAE